MSWANFPAIWIIADHWHKHIYLSVHTMSLQLCLTLCDPMDSSPPGSSVHGILQARKLECITILFSTGSSWPKDRTQALLNCRQILYHLSHGEVLVKHSEEGLWALRKDGGHLGSFPRLCWINPKPVFFITGVTRAIIEKWDTAKKQKEELENPVKTTVNVLCVYVSRSVDISFKMRSHCTLQLSLSSIHAHLFI